MPAIPWRKILHVIAVICAVVFALMFLMLLTAHAAATTGSRI